MLDVYIYKGKNVRKIDATAQTAEEDRILRVAACCRVSTDDIDPLFSIRIYYLPDFRLHGADGRDGGDLSGTRATDLPEMPQRISGKASPARCFSIALITRVSES